MTYRRLLGWTGAGRVGARGLGLDGAPRRGRLDQVGDRVPDTHGFGTAQVVDVNG